MEDLKIQSQMTFKLNSDCDNDDLKVHENVWCKQLLRYEESSDLFHCSYTNGPFLSYHAIGELNVSHIDFAQSQAIIYDFTSI